MTPAVLAFDVGGTDVKSGISLGAGPLRDVRRTPTARDRDRPAEAVVAQIAELSERLRAEHPDLDVQAVGVSIPGVVNEEAGIGVVSNNLGWRDAPIRDLAAAATGLPIAFGHDVRAAGLAEYILGAGRGYRSVVVIPIGTGIAGMLLLDGHPYSGGGFAGEIGHVLIDPAGAVCSCGARGCLETIASAGGIAKRYSERSGTPVRGATEVLARLDHDPVAQAVWAEAITALAQQLQRVISLLGPEAIVIGGGLSRAGDALFEPLRSQVDALLSFQKRPAIVPAELGEDAGLIGTGIAAWDLAQQLAS